jgi:hypothetical protein
MLIDDAAKVAARLDAGNGDEDAIFAETRLQAFEQAAGLSFAIIASVTNEDARLWPLRATCAQEFFTTCLMSLPVPFG